MSLWAYCYVKNLKKIFNGGNWDSNPKPPKQNHMQVKPPSQFSVDIVENVHNINKIVNFGANNNFVLSVICLFSASEASKFMKR